MRNLRKRSQVARLLMAALIVCGVGVLVFSGGTRVSANHPVLVEGNCDSPVPGTTLVAPGTCGDFDGDGRIGTAEDTDGADRIFGTINAALGTGTGAAAGTGANHNGQVTIVTSGRFYEVVYIGQNLLGPGNPGAANPGNVTLEAAPGVDAQINAVFQGDPAGQNAARVQNVGIGINYSLTNNVVTLRNLTVRNFDTGIFVSTGARVVIDNCRVENNISYGIRVVNGTAVINNTRVEASGFRTGVGSSTPTPGNGLEVLGSGQARVINSVFAQNNNCGIANFTNNAAAVQVYQVSAFFNSTGDSGGVCGAITVAPNPNFASQ
jgi:hypothetical protein